jgi:hypothetical protein
MQEHQIVAEVSYYSHGGVRGIKYGIDIGQINSDGSPRLLWKQGNNLNKYKYSFKKIQAELGVTYEPDRDDKLIKNLNEMMQLHPIEQDRGQNLSTPVPKLKNTLSPIFPEPEAKQKRQYQSKRSAAMYKAFSRGLENLLPTDRDKQIAARAFHRGLKAEEVEEIIAASPVDWTRNEAKLIVSFVRSHWEQERESLQQQQRQQQQKSERNQDRGISL